jgi:hypothetical protein
VPPIDQAGGYPGADKLFLQEELDDKLAKVFRHSVEVCDRDMREPTGLIEASFQDEAVKMGVEPQKLATGLVCQDHSGPDRPFAALS